MTIKSLALFILKYIGERVLQLNLEIKGPYTNWQNAINDSDTYDSIIICKKVERATRDVLESKMEYERDGTTFVSKPNKYPLGDVLENTLRNSGKILDFGGGMGGTFLANREILERKNIAYFILEQASFAEVGKRLAREYRLPIIFRSRISSQLLSNVDVLILSGVIQYIGDYKSKIHKLISRKPKVIVLDRIPLSTAETKIWVQRNLGYYQTSTTYPVHYFNKLELLAQFQGYDVIQEWHSPFDPKNYFGFLLEIHKAN